MNSYSFVLLWKRQMLLFLFVSSCWAQAAKLPHIGYVYPAGGQQGSAFEVNIGGQYLDNVYAVHVSGGSIKAEILEHIVPETPQRIKRALEKAGQNKIEKDLPADMVETEKIKDIGRTSRTMTAKKKAETDAIPESYVAENGVKTTLKKRIRTLKQQLNPQIEETVIVRLTIGPDGQAGQHELRLLTSAGASNPVVFYISNLTEYCEQEPNDKKPGALVLSSFPLALNGQIMPGDIDRFRIMGKKGQSLVFQTKARALVPYLADAVPGWFQAVTVLYDANGKEMGYVDDYEFDPDPVLFFDVPEDGEYVLEIRDSIYRGREDFVYRIFAGELPFITNHFPLGGPSQSKVSVEFSGKNLPVTSLMYDTGNNCPYAYFDLKNKEGLVSNSIRFDIDTLAEVFESEPDNNRQEAQSVTLPVIVNGCIQAPGDWDVFSFNAKAGQEITAEVIARRLNSPLDSILQLIDANSKQLQANDDYEDKGAGLLTHHADSYLTYKLPADGIYFIQLGDVQNKGSNEHAYRLRIGPKQPDFALRVVPSSITIRNAGSSAVMTVYSLRKDGFDGAIRLSVDKGTSGFTMDNAEIASKEEKAELTITASADVQPGIFFPQITGTALIQARECQRQAVPADDLMQAFSYRHLVPSEELFVLVTAPAAFTLSVDTSPGERIKIPAESFAAITVDVTRLSDDVHGILLNLKDPPQGITMSKTGIRENATSQQVIIEAGKDAKVGLKGNLILTGAARFNKQVYVITCPAIPFEIVE